MLETIIHKTNILNFFRGFDYIICCIFRLMNIFFGIGFFPCDITITCWSSFPSSRFLVIWRLFTDYRGHGRIKTENLYLENIFGLA